MDDRFEAARERARELLEEHDKLTAKLRQENVILADNLQRFHQETLLFKGKLAKILGVPELDDALLIKRTEEQVAVALGNTQDRVRTHVESLGHNYRNFLMLIENMHGHHDSYTAVMRDVLAHLLGPVVVGSSVLRPLVKMNGTRALKRLGV